MQTLTTPGRMLEAAFGRLFLVSDVGTTLNPIRNGQSLIGPAGSAATLLQEAIAYSAINEGEMPFGDTGIRAMFDDAADLGHALNVAGANSTIARVSDALAEMLVEYAGKLAIGDVESHNSPGHESGILDLSQDHQTLSVDLSEGTGGRWNVGATHTSIMGRTDLLRTALSDIAIEQITPGNPSLGIQPTFNVRSDMLAGLRHLYSARPGYAATDPARVIDRIVLKTGTGSAPIALDPSSNPGNSVALFVAGDGSDTITGSGDDEIIYGGAGNDVIAGGDGDDLIAGGDNSDTLSGGAGRDFLAGGAGVDTIDLGLGGQTSGFTLTLTANAPTQIDERASFDFNDGIDTDRAVDIEKMKLTGFSDTVVLDDLGDANGERPMADLTIDLGRADQGRTSSLWRFDDDMVDLSDAGRSITTTGLFGSTTTHYGVRVDLRDTANQTVQYLSNSALTTGTGGYFTGLYAGLLGRSQVMVRTANANSVTGTQYDDVLIGNAGKMSDGEGYSTLHGGAGNDFLADRGWESHLFGDSGKDEFSVGSSTWVEDGEVGDTVDWGIRLTGGVNQWWQETGIAYWAPFSSLTAAFPVIGSELLYTAAFLIDQVTMKFARYHLDANGALLIDLWGQTASAGVRNYNLDLNSGRGTAGITVFSSGHGTDTNKLGQKPSDSSLVRFVNLALKAGFGVGFGSFDPLVLDLNGDGFNLTAEPVSNIHFEFDGDGFGERTGWARATDGFLVRDANANGKIDNVTEMFGNAATGGFDLLAGCDGNLDGAITASDSVYAELQVWQDLNQDGVTDAGELKTLAQLGIISISLTHAAPASPTAIGGNGISQVGTFTWANGTTGSIADVLLAINETNSKWLGSSTVDSAAAALPELAGFGELRNLRIAMTTDATLKAEVAAFAASTSNDLPALSAAAETILYRWAGVDGVAVTAIGTDGFDTRKLAFLEKYSGYALMPRNTNGAIELDNLDEVEALWNDQLTRLTLRLVVQGPLAETFDGLTYHEDIDLLVADSPNALADLLHRLIVDLPADAGQAASIWSQWAPLLGAVTDGMVRSDANVVRSDYLFVQLLRAADGVDQPLSLEALATALGIANLRLGTPGNDTLARGAASDTAIYFSGGGDDVFTGGGGQDVYVFGHDIGHATINDVEPNPAGDRIRFAFLAQSDVTLARDGNDLLITINATNETVRITGQFAPVVPLGSDILLSSNKGIEDIQFADGSIMEIPEIMAAVGKGSSGDDHLIGTMHSDVLTAGRGNDLVEGGDDADLYVFNRGDGNDIFRDQQTTPLLRSADLLVFGDDIAPNDLTYARAGSNGDDLLITVANGGGSITVAGQFAYTSLGYNGTLAPNSRIEVFAFRNYGDSFSNKDLQQQLISQATTDGNDVTRGFGDDDVFMQSTGNDVLIGMDGADTYYWGAGAGSDIIREQAQYIDINVGLGGISLTVRADVVQFDGGVSPSMLTFSRNYDTDDLVITNKVSGETLTVDGQFNSFQTGVLGPQWFDRIEWFAFGDGSAYSWKDIETMVTTGTSGADRLRGDILADRMVGGAGNDLLSGGGGGDTYVFNVGDGHDTVFDDNRTLIGDGFLTADQTIDVIQLGAGITPGDIGFARDGSSITLIIGTSDDRVTLQGQDDYIQTGVFGAIPTSRIEQVKFDNGTVWTWQDVNQKMIAAQTTAGNDVTEGFTLADRFEKSAGDDILRGGESGDTYVFGVGAGHDRIEESVDNVLYGDNDSVEFDNSVSVADVSVARDGNDLILTLTSGDSLRIAGEFDLQTLYTWTDVENFRFADGTVWSKTNVQQKLLQSTSGNDHLVGFYSGDDLDGGAGNDLLEGKDGSDTYHFDRGYGNDEIRESVTELNVGDFDTVAFGPTLLPEDLTVSRDGNDLIFTVIDTGETLRVASQFNFSTWYSWNDVELFTFANGTQWTDLQIAARLTGGTSGNDHLIGTFRSDTLDGKEGDDLLEGGDGSDIYVFGRGYGHDEIRESLSEPNLSEDDEVRFGANITLADLGFTRDGDNLVISILGTNDRLTLTSEFTYSTPYTWNDVERFTFSDGSFITKEQITQIVLTGTSADEHIIGFGSGDTIDGKGGDDILEGMDGSDTYRFGVGDGHDRILETLEDGRSSEYDTLSFKDGVLPGDVTVTRDGQDAVFTLTSGDTIRVVGQFNEGYNEFLSSNDVERVTFADGTEWDKIEIDRRSIHTTSGDDLMLGSRYAQTYDGGAGNDTIYGGTNNDTLIGGTGNDRLEGDAGDDVYIYNLGDGDDVIHDYMFGGDGADRIKFGAGIAPGDLRFASNPADSSEIIISFAGAAGSIRVQNQWWSDTGIEFLEFADGTVWDQSQIAAAWIAGQVTSGDDTVFGSGGDDVLGGAAGNDRLLPGGGNDQLTGGAGNDRLEGDAGNDTYIYNIGDGDDVIYDYNWRNDGADRIVFGAGINPADIRFASNPADSSDVLISFATMSGSIRLQNQWWSDAGVESFVFADGTVWDQATIAARYVAAQSSAGNDVIYSTPFGGAIDAGAGNDVVHSGDADDIITGGTGNDRLESGYGNDRYIYNLGDGDDVIYDYSWRNDQDDRIIFGAGINPNDVIVSRTGDNSDLLISFKNVDGSILIQNQYYSDAGIEHIEFADGTIWDGAELERQILLDPTIRGSAGDDTITLPSNYTKVVAGAGNDVLSVNGNGGGVIVFRSGDGHDSLDNPGSGYHRNDILDLKDLNPADVSLGHNGDQLTVTLLATGDTFLVRWQFWQNSPDYGLAGIKFADGTIWDRARIQQEAWIRGDAANNSLYGGDGADVFAGGLGNDYLEGRAGSDTYRYASGDGGDRINDAGSVSDVDVLKLVDLNASNVSLRHDGAHLYIRDIATGQETWVENQFWDGHPDWGIERIEFADGTVWNRTRIQQEAWIRGDAGNNSLYGGNGADVFAGGLGADYLEGRSGNDTYRYASGDGGDQINDAGNVSDVDTLKLTDLNVNDVSLRRNGVHLYVRDVATGQEIWVENQFWDGHPDWGIEQIQFANGTTWDRARILAEIGAINGTSGADQLTGTADANLIHGGAGNDLADGLAGNDSIDGGDGNDTLIGGLGEDRVDGDGGNDILYGDGYGPLPSGANLIVNGSFEIAGTIVDGGSWGRGLSDMQGWSKANAQNYEQVNSGFGGISATDGAYWLDMDSGGGSGSNMDISQTITGLVDGDLFLLSFDHANRNSASSGSFEVYWNGSLIATVDQTGTTMMTTSLSVTALAGGNILRFKGIGAEDNGGASLDNVQLRHAAIQQYGGGNDQLNGGTGDDVLIGGGGNDALDGGDGNDVAQFIGNSDDYLVTANGDGTYTVADQTADRDGTDAITAVETFRFADGDFLADDLTGNGQRSAQSFALRSATLPEDDDAGPAGIDRSEWWRSMRPTFDPPMSIVSIADLLPGPNEGAASVDRAASILSESIASFGAMAAGDGGGFGRTLPEDRQFWLARHASQIGAQAPMMSDA
jgi:Ca2+-binding RTX toxin-like protein